MNNGDCFYVFRNSSYPKHNLQSINRRDTELKGYDQYKKVYQDKSFQLPNKWNTADHVVTRNIILMRYF